MYPVFSSEKVSDDYLCINSCDCQTISGITMGSKRIHGRIDYQMLYIADGTCYVNHQGIETPVHKNSVILYLPNQPQIYSFHAEDASISYYIHFCGTFCEKILKELKIYEHHIIQLADSSKIEPIFEKLIREFHTRRPFYEQYCNGLLLNLFSEIARSANHLSGNAINQNKLHDVCAQMHKNYAQNLSIDYYADLIHLSVGRFTHIFTQTMGISPKQYLIHIKIDHAIELLSNTDLSIAQIAELVGIPDSNYFSRLFKKHLGHTPMFYR